MRQLTEELHLAGKELTKQGRKWDVFVFKIKFVMCFSCKKRPLLCNNNSLFLSAEFLFSNELFFFVSVLCVTYDFFLNNPFTLKYDRKCVF